MRHQYSALIAVVVITLTGCATSRVQQSSDFVQRQQTLRSIAVVPAEVVQVFDSVGDDAVRNEPREKQIQQSLRTSAENKLRNQGYVVNTQLYERLEDGGNDLAVEFEQFKRNYSRLLGDANYYAFSGNATLVTSSIGQLMTAWAADAKVDAILFVRYRGLERSTGKAVVDSIPGVVIAAVTGVGYVAKKRAAYLESILIDAISGEILWRNGTGETEVKPFRQRVMTPQQMLNVTLALIPVATANVSNDANMTNNEVAVTPAAGAIYR